MGLGTLNSVMVSASTDFTGVAVDGDFVGVAVFIILPIASGFLVVMAFLSNIGAWDKDTRTKTGMGIAVLMTLIAIGAIVTLGYLIFSNTSKYEENMNALTEHYGVKYLEVTENTAFEDAGGVFVDKSEKSLYEASVEHNMRPMDVYLAEVEEDRWAILVEPGANTGEDLVEFDDFAGTEDDNGELEEMGD